ncbi:unnamed protein product [Allacma fusca]|uniref:Uncharacterized protein n=1 Tax=Allacma fusca TaxID=39272 RepID=A0A8J2J9G4_9HEXA|nr:unnamed protein product [Allacma fusca]
MPLFVSFYILRTLFVIILVQSSCSSKRLPQQQHNSPHKYSWWEVVDAFVKRLESFRRTPAEMDALRSKWEKIEGDKKTAKILEMARREEAIKELRANIAARKKKQQQLRRSRLKTSHKQRMQRDAHKMKNQKRARHLL